MIDGEEKIIKAVKINNANTTTINNTDYHEFDHSYSISSEVLLQEVSVNIEENEIVSAINLTAPSQNYTENESSTSKKTHETNKVITKNDVLLTEAQIIIDYFILSNAKFEVNITDKTKRAIICNFKEIKLGDLKQQDFKDRLRSIFDNAYKEVITSLFLNSYMHYITRKEN